MVSAAISQFGKGEVVTKFVPGVLAVVLGIPWISQPIEWFSNKDVPNWLGLVIFIVVSYAIGATLVQISSSFAASYYNTSRRVHLGHPRVWPRMAERLRKFLRLFFYLPARTSAKSSHAIYEIARERAAKVLQIDPSTISREHGFQILYSYRLRSDRYAKICEDHLDRADHLLSIFFLALVYFPMYIGALVAGNSVLGLPEIVIVLCFLGMTIIAIAPAVPGRWIQARSRIAIGFLWASIDEPGIFDDVVSSESTG